MPLYRTHGDTMRPQDEDERQHRRRSSDQPSLSKHLGLAVVAIAIVTSIFTAGYNWRSVTEIEKSQGDFVRKDVQAEQVRVQGEQMQRLNDRLLEVLKQLDDMRVEQRAARQK